MNMITRLFIVLMVMASGAVVVADPVKGHTQGQQMQSQTMGQQPMHRMMSQQDREQMLQYVQQMRENVLQISTMLQQHPTMSETNRSDAAKVMLKMSSYMQELSKQIEKGNFDDKSVAMLNEHNQQMTKMMKRLIETW